MKGKDPYEKGYGNNDVFGGHADHGTHVAGIIGAVRDNGIGIDAQQIEEILEPFKQADNGLSRDYEGTGLGLPISKALAELHGGALEINSAPGKGTRVTVSFPASRTTALPAQEVTAGATLPAAS